MVGMVICAHGNLAHEFLSAVKFITENAGSITALPVDHNVDSARARADVKEAILSADEGNGVLVFTDLYGGTPSNICISLQGELKMEIIAGVNLPILLKAVSLQKAGDLETIARKLRDYGRENIYLASDFLKKKNAPDVA
ncbi:MAG: PTS sugar transporter subunit IIA [Nitrospinae bacterium]|nr:PTS sugar transporter subunit IIA [Nitrospinota bacterium]